MLDHPLTALGVWCHWGRILAPDFAHAASYVWDHQLANTTGASPVFFVELDYSEATHEMFEKVPAGCHVRVSCRWQGFACGQWWWSSRATGYSLASVSGCVGWATGVLGSDDAR